MTLTQEDLERIVDQIPIEQGDLITCGNCNGLHNAQPIAANGSGVRMSITCGDKLIIL